MFPPESDLRYNPVDHHTNGSRKLMKLQSSLLLGWTRNRTRSNLARGCTCGFYRERARPSSSAGFETSRPRRGDRSENGTDSTSTSIPHSRWSSSAVELRRTDSDAKVDTEFRGIPANTRSTRELERGNRPLKFRGNRPRSRSTTAKSASKPTRRPSFDSRDRSESTTLANLFQRYISPPLERSTAHPSLGEDTSIPRLAPLSSSSSSSSSSPSATSETPDQGSRIQTDPQLQELVTHLVQNCFVTTQFSRQLIRSWTKMDRFFVQPPIVDTDEHEHVDQDEQSPNNPEVRPKVRSSAKHNNVQVQNKAKRRESGDLVDFLRFVRDEMRRKTVPQSFLQVFPAGVRRAGDVPGTKLRTASDLRLSAVPSEYMQEQPPAKNLSLLLPPFLLHKFLYQKAHTLSDYLLLTQTFCRLIEAGAYPAQDQAEILTFLVKRAGRFVGASAVLPSLGEMFLERVVKRGPKIVTLRAEPGTVPATKVHWSTRFRTSDFEPMILVLVSHLSRRQASINDELQGPARRLLGRILLHMHDRSVGWRLGLMGLLLDSRVISGKGRQAIWRWMYRRRQAAANGDVVTSDADRDLLFAEAEVDRWMHPHVKDFLFAPSGTTLVDGVSYLRFREESQVRALGHGEMTVRMSDILFQSALRDEELEWARKNFLAGNKIASDATLKDSQSADATYEQVRGMDRAVGMAAGFRNERMSSDLVGVVERLTAGAPDQDLRQLRSRAWVVLLGHLGDNRAVSTREWLETCSQIPSEMQDDRGILTAQMYHHTNRHLSNSAWQSWQQLVDTKQLDAMSIMLGAKLKSWDAGAEEAFSFVDDWAEQPNRLHGDDVRARIDNIAVKVLLNIARYHLRPDLTTWLWQNMSSRWGVEPDDDSLASMIRGIDLAYLKDNKGGRNDWEQHNGQPKPINAPARSERFTVDAIYEWQDVAGLFRDIALRTYPSLRSIKSPMEDGRISSAFRQLTASGHSPSASVEEQHLSKSPPWQLLPVDPPFRNIKLSSGNFHVYIVTLLHQSLYDDAVLALGWMKGLSLDPNRATLIAVLQALADSGQPKDMRFLKEQEGWGKYRLMAADEWLRYWLEQWLGSSRTPTDDQVAEAVRERLEIGG